MFKHVKGLTVEVRGNDINFALRKLKKKVQEDGRIREVRERKEYEKPTTKRKKARAAAKSRWQKKLAAATLHTTRLY